MKDINGTTRKCLPDSSTTAYSTTALAAQQKLLPESSITDYNVMALIAQPENHAKIRHYCLKCQDINFTLKKIAGLSTSVYHAMVLMTLLKSLIGYAEYQWHFKNIFARVKH
jgi:hypothetical protein